MNIAITGSAGFIGASICKYLELNGCNLTKISCGKLVSENINICPINLMHSLQDYFFSQLKGVDCVIHCAGLTSSRASQDVINYSNVTITQDLALAAAKAGVKRLIFLSTIKVNGEQTNSEAFTPFSAPNPQTLYAKSKLEAEKTLRAISTQTGMHIIIIRPPLVFGAGVKGNLRKLVNIIKIGIPLPFEGIDNFRSIIGIDNLVDFVYVCAQKDDYSENACHLMLLSEDEDLSTSNLLKRIAFALGRDLKLFRFLPEYVPSVLPIIGMGDIYFSFYSSLRIDGNISRSNLSWRPKYNIDEQMKRMVENDQGY
jgi:nucleoside-diphosphate-sugar epimerase